MYGIFKDYIQIFFLNACYFSSACCCVGCFVVGWGLDVNHISAGWVFPPSVQVHPPPTPSFCFRSRLSSQTSISFLTTSLLLFSYLLLIAGSDCLMVTALKCLAAVVASLTRQR